MVAQNQPGVLHRLQLACCEIMCGARASSCMRDVDGPASRAGHAPPLLRLLTAAASSLYSLLQGMRALLHSLGLRMDKLEQTVAAILHSLGLRMDELEQTVAAILRQVAAVREDVAAVRGDVAAVAAATAGELAVVREAAIGVARGVAAVADRQAATDARVTEQASMLIEHDIKIKQLGVRIHGTAAQCLVHKSGVWL